MDDLGDGLSVVVPDEGRLDDLFRSRSLRPFDEEAVKFVDTLGRHLRTDSETRRFPELVALGFWARKSNVERLRRTFESAYPGRVRLCHGLAFHIAPANVDTIFIYSLLISMLAGNRNLVRLSSRSGEQSDQLLTVFRRALSEAAPTVRSSIAVVRYERHSAFTESFSSRCDLRIIWGGDATVREVRALPLRPAAKDIVFPNKYSLSVLDAEAWLAAEDRDQIARRFANDALWFGQMACSSPRSVVWRGSADVATAASSSFWKSVESAAAAGAFEWDPSHAVMKLIAEQISALEDGTSILDTTSNRVRVIRCSPAFVGSEVGAGHGFFREARVETLGEIVALAKSDWQTVASFGIDADEWRAALYAGLPRGLDRIVPIGSALNFDAIWDGKDLLAEMTRIVAVDVERLP